MVGEVRAARSLGLAYSYSIEFHVDHKRLPHSAFASILSVISFRRVIPRDRGQASICCMCLHCERSTWMPIPASIEPERGKARGESTLFFSILNAFKRAHLLLIELVEAILFLLVLNELQRPTQRQPPAKPEGMTGVMTIEE